MMMIFVQVFLSFVRLSRSSRPFVRSSVGRFSVYSDLPAGNRKSQMRKNAEAFKTWRRWKKVKEF